MSSKGRHFVAALLALSTATSVSFAQSVAVPGAGVDASKWPDADAVILEWDQSWVLGEDGSVRRRDHQLIKLLNMRPARQFADPRIDYCDGQDELIIHAARTVLPDGTRLDVPEYSFNSAAADDVSGWPEYACWRQRVVSFSGVQPGCVLELDYEIVTRAGVLPWLSADLQLNSEHPILRRQVSVLTSSKLGALTARVDGISPAAYEAVAQVWKGEWKFKDLPAVPHEPQASPWREDGARLRFTTGGPATTWARVIGQKVRNAVGNDETIRKFAEAAAADEPDAMERVRKISAKLRDRFNFVNSSKTLRSWTCRPASEVNKCNYGNPLESAALLQSLLASSGFEAEAVPAVDGVGWDEALAVDAAFAGVVVVLSTGEQELYFHPQHGEIVNPDQWGRRWLLRSNESGGLDEATYIFARGEEKPSELNMGGKIVISDDGKATGEVRLRITGAFYDPLKLKAADAQKKLVENMVGRVLSGFDVTGHSMVTLSNDLLQVTAQVATKEPMKQVGGQHILQFGSGPAFLPDIPLPLDRSLRRTKIRTVGAFREGIDIVVELPKLWPVPVCAESTFQAGGQWGSISQEMKASDRTVRLRRNIEMTSATLSPEEFGAVREAVNTLRTVQHTHLLLSPR